MTKIFGAKLDVLPRLSMEYVENRDDIDPEYLCEFRHWEFIRNIGTANVVNVKRGEFRISALLADWFASLVPHIFEVVSTSAKKKMVRVYAPSIIARVADVFSFWNLSFEKFIGVAMCVLCCALSSSAFRKLAVPISETFIPVPTFICCSLGKSGLESLVNGFPHQGYIT